jgi:hypothetical protein
LMLYRHIIAEVRVVNPVTGPADQLATKKAAAQMLYNEPLHFDHRLAHVTGDRLSKPGSAPDQNCARRRSGSVNTPCRRSVRTSLIGKSTCSPPYLRSNVPLPPSRMRSKSKKMPALDFRQLQWFTHVCLCSFKKSGRAVVSHLRQLPGVVTLIPRPSGLEHRKTLPAICRALSSRGVRNSGFATSDFSSPSGSSMA